MRNLSIRCGAGKTPGQQLPLPQRSSASMSFGWLFLGGMLSSRARLRFTNREQCAVNSVHRSSLLQRTANYLLTVCLTPGGKRTTTVPLAFQVSTTKLMFFPWGTPNARFVPNRECTGYLRFLYDRRLKEMLRCRFRSVGE